jgi:hypothetical protein
MNRWNRSFAALGLAAMLGVGVSPTPARAQEPAPGEEGEDKSGRPLDGYLATGAMAFLALFIVAKSARR